MLAIAAATKKTTNATQFSPSEIDNRPVGGMWKKLKQSAESNAVSSPSRRPQIVEIRSTAIR